LEVGPQGFSRPGHRAHQKVIDKGSDTDMAFPPRSRERARWLMVSFSHKRDLLRDNGRDNKRRSMPSQLRSKLDSNPGTSAVLSCTWSPTAVSVRMTAKHLSVINDRGSENACEHGLVGCFPYLIKSSIRAGCTWEIELSTRAEPRPQKVFIAEHGGQRSHNVESRG